MNKYNEVTKHFIKQFKDYVHQKRKLNKLRKYYVERKTDGRSSVGKTIDYMGSRIIIFLSSLLILLIISKQLQTAFILGTLWTITFHIIDVYIRNKKTKEIINQGRKYLGSQRVYKELMGKNIDEMCAYICQVFESIGFELVRQENHEEKGFYHLFKYREKNFPVFCKINPYDENMKLKELESYGERLRKNGFEKGIMIVTTDFVEECYDFVKKNSELKLILIEKEKFLKIIDKAGFFPPDQEMDEYILDRIEKRERKRATYKDILLSKSKTKRYVLLGFFLLFWASFTPFSSYYIFMSILLFALAILTFYCNIKREVDKGKEFNLERFIEG